MLIWKWLHVRVLNGKRAGGLVLWTRLGLRLSARFERDLHCRLLLHMSRVSAKSLTKVFCSLEDVSPERGPHESIEERVNAGVGQRQGLCHLDSSIQVLADFTVGHEDVDDVHRSAQLDHIVGQLGEQENSHHSQQDPKGTPLPVSPHPSCLTQRPPYAAVADHHDQEGEQEPKGHLQQLQGSLGRSGHLVRVDGCAGHPVMRVLHCGEDELGNAKKAGYCPQHHTHQDPLSPHVGSRPSPACWIVGHSTIAIHTDARQQQHATAEVGTIEEGGDLAGSSTQLPAVDGVSRPERQSEEKQQIWNGEVEDAHVRQGS